MSDPDERTGDEKPDPDLRCCRCGKPRRKHRVWCDACTAAANTPPGGLSCTEADEQRLCLAVHLAERQAPTSDRAYRVSSPQKGPPIFDTIRSCKVAIRRAADSLHCRGSGYYARDDSHPWQDVAYRCWEGRRGASVIND